MLSEPSVPTWWNLAKNQQESQQYIVEPSSITSALVHFAPIARTNPRIVTLNPEGGTADCSCLKSQQHLFPCKHVVAVHNHFIKAISPYISDSYSLTTYKATYAIPLPPVVVVAENLTVDEDLKAPRVKKGGKGKKKKMEKGAKPPPKMSRCGGCKKMGHNLCTCPEK